MSLLILVTIFLHCSIFPALVSVSFLGRGWEGIGAPKYMGTELNDHNAINVKIMKFSLDCVGL